MKPALALSDLFGRDCAYCPGTSFVAPGWLQGGRGVRDLRTGDHLALAGPMPVVCSRAAATPEGLGLLREAGIEPAPDLRTYAGPGEYARILADLARAGPIAFQHVHDSREIDPARYRVARDLLSSLNNKANLSQLVPEDQVPRRRVVAMKDLRSGRHALAPPLVLKGATDEPTGGGRAVRICRDAGAVRAALDHLARCGSVVVEEYIEMERSLCVQYAVLATGEVRHIGFAEQVVSEEGRYLGNVLDTEDRAPADVVRTGLRIAEEAAGRGYRGVAGFDVALCRDGRHLFLDLNFRLNGSTAPVLLLGEASRRLGSGVMRYATFEASDADALLRSARHALAEGRFLPLAFYDPRAIAAAGEPARISGLVRGRSGAGLG